MLTQVSLKSIFFFIMSLLALYLYSDSNTVLAFDTEIYSQTTYLHKFRNPITQNKIVLHENVRGVNVYGGVYFDYDAKSGVSLTYTDAQVSPLIGVQSKVYGWDFLYNRLFLESRYVHRIKSFPDERTKETYEVRAGVIGYGLTTVKEFLFFENYYSFFFSRLYDERFLIQGWARQGMRMDFFDVFNEFFYDSFDQTRGRDGSFDLRPGVRLHHQFAKGSVQLIHQYLYHLSNLAFAGRNEHRTSLVFGFYF